MVIKYRKWNYTPTAHVDDGNTACDEQTSKSITWNRDEIMKKYNGVHFIDDVSNPIVDGYYLHFESNGKDNEIDLTKVDELYLLNSKGETIERLV